MVPSSHTLHTRQWSPFSYPPASTPLNNQSPGAHMTCSASPPSWKGRCRQNRGPFPWSCWCVVVILVWLVSGVFVSFTCSWACLKVNRLVVKLLGEWCGVWGVVFVIYWILSVLFILWTIICFCLLVSGYWANFIYSSNYKRNSSFWVIN